MKRIFIIGAGQLGSRHLQALKSSSNSLNIFIVDPSLESLNIAKEEKSGRLIVLPSFIWAINGLSYFDFMLQNSLRIIFK